MDQLSYRKRFIPGVEESYTHEELSFIFGSGSSHEGHDIRLSISPETLDLWKKKGELWSWKKLHEGASGVLISRDLKEIERVLKQRHLTMTEVPETDLFFQEKSFTYSFKNQWSGFSRDLVIIPDKISGWWLEVPGSVVSLWAQNGATLLALTENKNLPENLQKKFSAWGFGGVTELPEVSSFDWLWWDSVRFMDRLGPLAKKGDASAGVIFEDGYSPPERRSRRGHENCRLVTAQELDSLAAKVFVETGRVRSEWYGAVSRLRGPSGGGAFELELWALVNECKGLKAGLYRYSGNERKFEHHPDKGLSDLWLHRARDAWGKKYGFPQVVFAIAGDLRKLPKKYLRLPLQISLVNAGVRLSEIIDAGEAEGLSMCALGGGILRELGEVLDLHPLVYGVLSEVAVGGPSE